MVATGPVFALAEALVAAAVAEWVAAAAPVAVVELAAVVEWGAVAEADVAGGGVGPAEVADALRHRPTGDVPGRRNQCPAHAENHLFR